MKANLLKKAVALTMSALVLFSSVGGNTAYAATNTEPEAVQEATETVAAEELEISNEMRGATAVTGGLSYTDAVAVNVNTAYATTVKEDTGDVFFKFTLTQPGIVRLTFKETSGTGNYVYGRFNYTVSGTSMYSFDIEPNTSFAGPNVGLDKGTYYLCYQDYWNADYNCEFTVNFTPSSTCETESNDTIGAADAIDVNKTYTASSMYSNQSDDDYFKFSLSKPGYIQLELTHDIINGKESSKEFYIKLYNSSAGNEIYDYDSIGGEKSAKSMKIGLPAGTYWFKVNASRYATDYQVKVNYTASDVWEQEVNSTTTLANKMNLNTKYTGTIIDWSDDDFFKFTTTNDGKVSLSFTHDSIAGSETYNCYYVKLYGDAALQNEIYSMSIKGAQTSVNTPEIGLPAGTYYVKVYGSSDALEPYGLKVNYTKSSYWEKEANETATTATSISSGKTYSGSIRDYADKDYYKIKMSSAGYMTINLKHSATTTKNVYYMRVYNSALNEVAYYYIAGTDNDFTTAKIPLGAGTYYILLDDSSENYTGTYKLTATATKASGWETEINNSTSAADNITVGKTVKATSHYDGDSRDYFKFSVSSAGYYNFSIEHDEINGTGKMYSGEILNSRGNYVTFTSLSSDEADTYAESKPIKLEKGTYYVNIYSFSRAYGEEYKLTVNKVAKKTPSITSVKSAGHNKMTVSWKAVPGAIKYEIYRATSKSGKYTKVKTISDVATTSWTDTKVKTGSTYYYKMKCTVETDKKKSTSGYSSVKSAKVVPAAPAISSVKSSSSKTATVTWKKVTGASGYEVYRATSKSGKYTKVTTVTKGSTVSYKNTKLTSKKTYYYKVRAYRTVNGKKVYSSYSEIKSVKVK